MFYYLFKPIIFIYYYFFPPRYTTIKAREMNLIVEHKECSQCKEIKPVMQYMRERGYDFCFCSDLCWTKFIT
tara:strand:- start:568 stop:783 length:216 start_codon:yes stop_codon:yes gene_type:complete